MRVSNLGVGVCRVGVDRNDFVEADAINGQRLQLQLDTESSEVSVFELNALRDYRQPLLLSVVLQFIELFVNRLQVEEDVFRLNAGDAWLN